MISLQKMGNGHSLKNFVTHYEHLHLNIIMLNHENLFYLNGNTKFCIDKFEFKYFDWNFNSHEGTKLVYKFQPDSLTLNI